MQISHSISWKIAPNMPSQDIWKFTPVSYRTSALWGHCPALTPILQLTVTADHVRSLDDLLLFRRFLVFWANCSCPNALVTFSSTAPAHPHATGIAVYPALFIHLVVEHCVTWGPLKTRLSPTGNAPGVHSLIAARRGCGVGEDLRHHLNKPLNSIRFYFTAATISKTFIWLGRSFFLSKGRYQGAKISVSVFGKSSLSWGICPLLHLSDCLSVHSTVGLSVHLFVGLLAHLLVELSVHLSVGL